MNPRTVCGNQSVAPGHGRASLAAQHVEDDLLLAELVRNSGGLLRRSELGSRLLAGGLLRRLAAGLAVVAAFRVVGFLVAAVFFGAIGGGRFRGGGVRAGTAGFGAAVHDGSSFSGGASCRTP